ncbi:hypothetical protein [Xanthomonas translucens]|uniref:Uncharacterized protein n=2 Tax=Xanthomonas campestris pv. translucens TaxID=343 RepID=A0A1C3TKW1_XANCT|nr:hypothetical protein [Xanthomonas translucens]MCC8446817.1 hypothetical protein [Xanthomonas translucens pv. translucens]UNT97649.1 hypothetical protein KBQ49_11010 [Xanthomonas translucens pv. translucens]SCB03849.1 Conserved hypothetical protein [Xanthomonas translucens pv. translucens DSM 18974]
MSRDTNDHSDNPYRPRARTVRDPHHDAQLLRDVAIINAQVRDRLGPLPAGGLPVHTKRKPNLPPPPSVTAASAIYPPEDDPMKLHHLAAAAIMPMAVAAAGCSKGIDVGNDGATGHLNPHPVKRYEVIATSHAPGPWDTFEGAYVHYDVINTKCVPMIPFIGEQHVPNTGLDVPMTRVDDHTWKGYFYRDAMLDEDYFKLGVCHWDVTSVGVGAIAQGVRFSWGAGGEAFEELLRDSPEISYFKKSAYGDRSLAPYGAPDYSPLRPEYKKNPDDFFPVTIAVKEAKP